MITTDNIVSLIEELTQDHNVELTEVTKVNGEDYQVWHLKTRALLKGLELKDVDSVQYAYSNSKEDWGYKHIQVSELIAYLRNKRIDSLGL